MDVFLPGGEITASDALHLALKGTMLLDVREPNEWARGHSPLATALPMSQLEDRINEVPIDRDILVVCHSGQRSARVSGVLSQAGFRTANVSGGMMAIAAAGGELVAEGDDTPRVD